MRPLARSTLAGLAGLAAASALAAACSASDPGPVCSTGRMVGTSENEDMAPGRACIGCHAYANAGGDGMEAPAFVFAGTVYETAHEPDDCAGGPADAGSDRVESRAEIEVISATGQHHVAPVTAGGNFMLEAESLAFPVTAAIHFQGRTRWMLAPQPTGDCNLCHQATGSPYSPGRIRLP